MISAIADLYPYIFDVHECDPKHIATKAVRVKQHLEACDKPALLILDNVRDVEQWTRLRNSGFLPAGACDHLITTTDPDLPPAQPFPLERLSHEEGVDLLAVYRKVSLSGPGRQAAGVIVEWLGGVPFYLAIVAIYMRRNPGLTWQDFAQSLEATGLNAVRGAEDATGMLPDKYARRIDQVMDTLLDSLSESERQTLEYASLFQYPLMERLLLALLTNDATLTLQAMPGYQHPTQHVIQTLENERLLLPFGDGHTRAFDIHQILRRKINERIAANTNHRNHLLKNILSVAISSFVSPTHFTPADDPTQFLPSLMQFYHNMSMSFQVLERHGYIENAAGQYNYWLDFSHKMNSARQLALRLGGRVDLRLTPITHYSNGRSHGTDSCH